jgi:hypothetical protein
MTVADQTATPQFEGTGPAIRQTAATAQGEL